MQERQVGNGGSSGRDRPVLYLDIDDTLLTWADGHPRAAPGAREFVVWALERFDVRWLTTWCPNGQMRASLLADLCTMLELDPETVRPIEGFSWDCTDSKLNGIAWLEHLVLGRDFLWVEDDYGVRETELRVLAEQGFRENYHFCNVTEDPTALVRLHRELKEKYPDARDPQSWTPAA